MGSAHWPFSVPAGPEMSWSAADNDVQRDMQRMVDKMLGQGKICYWHGREPCKHKPEGFKPRTPPPGSEPVVVGVAGEVIPAGATVAVDEQGYARRYVR